jgi:hypothetical protein
VAQAGEDKSVIKKAIDAKVNLDAEQSYHATDLGAACLVSRQRGVILVVLHAYEITFRGQAGSVVRAEFDDCEVIIGPDTTTLRAGLPDQGALWGIVQRIIGLGLEVIDLHLVAPPVQSAGTRADSDLSGDGWAAPET